MPNNYFSWLYDPEFYKGPPDRVAAAEAAAVVPSGVVVDAVNNVGPALTGRATVLMWEPKLHDASWVIADTVRLNYPWPSVEDQRRRVPELVAAGYRIVYEKDGYVVLHRPG